MYIRLVQDFGLESEVSELLKNYFQVNLILKYYS